MAAKQECYNGRTNAHGISLNCTYSAGPGMIWSARVDFRPYDDGFEVWATVPDSDELSVVGRVTEKLTWRAAAHWLRSWGEGLGGDLFSTIEVYGASGHEHDMLAMCWVSFENPAEGIIDFLLALSDSDIAYLFQCHSSLISEEAILYIDRIHKAFVESKVETASLLDFAHHHGIKRLPDPCLYLDVIETAVFDANKKLYILNEIRSAVLKQSALDFSLFSASAVATRAMHLELYLTSWHADNGNFPRGVSHVASLGEIDFDLLFGMVEGYVRQQPDAVLSVEALEKCSKFKQPTVGEEILRIFHSWLCAPVKPKAVPTCFLPPVDLSCEAGFVYWLFSFSTAQFVAQNNASGFGSLLAWVRERKVTHFGTGMGGAWGAAVHRSNTNKWLNFREMVERVGREI